MGIFALIVILLLAIWAPRARLSRQAPLKDVFHSEITNAVGFAKSHFTGGVGVVLKADAASGLPMINQVVAGSPAEKAGLLKGDIIVQVDGVATRTLAQTVDRMRGFAAGSVTLTIQRPGSTNLEFSIHRNSWKSLGITN